MKIKVTPRNAEYSAKTFTGDNLRSILEEVLYVYDDSDCFMRSDIRQMKTEELIGCLKMLNLKFEMTDRWEITYFFLPNTGLSLI